MLRFYERHAFICALHKETRLLFDELVFCLQRLYSVPIKVDIPFANPDFTLDDLPTPVAPGSKRAEYDRSNNSMSDGRQAGACPLCSTSCSNCGSAGDGRLSSTPSTQTPTPTSTASGAVGISKTSLTRSRIPRPISLPKRLEAKLATRETQPRSQRSRTRGRRGSGGSPVATKPPIAPQIGPGGRKSRVRDTIRLFDSKQPNVRTPRATSASNRTKRPSSMVTKSPKTGAGESLAGFDSSEGTAAAPGNFDERKYHMQGD